MAKLYRVTLKGHVISTATANVFHVESAGPASDITAYFHSAVLPRFQEIMPSTCGFDAITAQEIGHLLLDPDYNTEVVTVAGVHNADGLTSDPQLAACVNLHTGLSGRTRRGRLFLFGTPDQWVENGKLTSGGASAINAQLALIRPLLDGTGTSICKWVVFSRKIYGSLTDIILDSYKPVTSHSLNQVMSTMRSRKPV